MRRNGLVGMLAATFACATLATPARAQQLSDGRIHELIKQAALRIANGAADVQQPAPTSPTRPVVALTLDDAVKFALDRNLDIAVQRLNPEINDISVAKIRSVYKPLLTSTISGAGLTQSIPWGGGSLSVALNNFRQTSTSSNVLYNPTIQQIWTGVYTQPLLR